MPMLFVYGDMRTEGPYGDFLHISGSNRVHGQALAIGSSLATIGAMGRNPTPALVPTFTDLSSVVYGVVGEVWSVSDEVMEQIRTTELARGFEMQLRNCWFFSRDVTIPNGRVLASTPILRTSALPLSLLRRRGYDCTSAAADPNTVEYRVSEWRVGRGVVDTSVLVGSQAVVDAMHDEADLGLEVNEAEDEVVFHVADFTDDNDEIAEDF